MYNGMFKNLKKLQSYYMTFNENLLVCLEGKKGLGKTTVIQEFLDSVKDCIQITPDNQNNYLSSVTRAILQYYHKHDHKIDEILLNSDFSYEEIVLEQMLEICAEQKCCLVIHSFTKCSIELVFFLQHSISSILRNGSNCLILIEIDTDDLQNQEKLQSLYQFPKQEHILFHPVPNDELRELLFREYPSLEIDQDSLDYIIYSADKNPALMNIILNYLKSKELLLIHDGTWICQKLKVGVLSNVLKDEIDSRFNRLDETMKNTFLKSSMFGMEFNIRQLVSSFEIISADETLLQIEKISNLLIQKNENLKLYSFTNDEVFNFAKSIISEKQKSEWSNVLYQYYYTLWNTPKNFSNMEVNDDIGLKIASYAIECGKYEEAVCFYIASFFHYFKENNFQQALIILNKIEEFPIKIQKYEITTMRLEEFKAICYESLGLYQKACAAYKKCIHDYNDFPYFDLMNIYYRLAFCTYYISQVNPALELAEKLKDNPDLMSRTDSLYYKVLSLLATIYREKGNPLSQKMFLLAINECKQKKFEYEYYVQLRKADLCFDVKLAFPMVMQAACYFRRGAYMKEYAKATHNLGTDYLYMDNLKKARLNFLRSQKVFSSFGSVDEVYAINCLGVWNALNLNYQNALVLFKDAESLNINDFKRMTVCTNIVSCYLKLHLYKECQEYIKKCEEIPAYCINKDIGFYQRSVLFSWAFYYRETKQYELSLGKFRECMNVNLKNDQLFLAAVCIVDLCKLMDLPVTDQEIKYSKISHSNLYDRYYRLGTIFHTLRFIE